MDWKAGGPALMHRCRYTIHPHSSPMESTSPTNGTNCLHYQQTILRHQNINDLARSEKALLEPPEPLRNRIESGKRNEENAETAFASYTAN